MAQARVEERINAFDAYELDPSTLDPKMHYRWCHPRSFARRTSQGYEIVLRSTHGVRFLVEDGRIAAEAGDRLWRGESYLMCCKKEIFNARRKRHVEYTQSLLNQEGVFANKARRRGVQPLVGEEGEQK